LIGPNIVEREGDVEVFLIQNQLAITVTSLIHLLQTADNFKSLVSQALVKQNAEKAHEPDQNDQGDAAT
jgi:hypothetical protein